MWNFYKRKEVAPLERPWIWRAWLRVVRNWVLVIVAVVAFADTWGLPFLRWNYEFYGSRENPHYIRATYIGPGGRKDVQADEYAVGCPLVLLLKPEPPLWRCLLDKTNPFLRD